MTSFIGREREMGEVKDLLRSTRLLTLTGSGGTGKTRLAQQVAADLLPGYPDGAWFAQRAAPHLQRAGQAVWVERLEREHDNLRAALAKAPMQDSLRITKRGS